MNSLNREGRVRAREGETFFCKFLRPFAIRFYNASRSSNEGSGVTMMAGSMRSMRTVPGFAPRMG